MIRTLAARIADLRSCARGASTIEVALLTPILCILMVGIVDVARVGAMKVKYQQAANRGIELAALGTLQSSEQAIKSQVAAASGVPESQVAVTFFLECDGTPMASYATTCAAGEESARYVRVQVAGQYVPMFNYGPLKPTISVDDEEDGGIPVSGGAVTRIQ